MTVAALTARPARSTEPVADTRHSAHRKIRTLIVDDQLLEREVMQRRLRNEPDIEIIGTAVNGLEAVEAIHGLKPDLVFLDVQMPELDGFGVVSKLDPARMPVIIFVTANQEFALRAFDVQALDYLIKPCGRDRLERALHRAREQIRHKEAGDIHQRISELLSGEKLNARHSERLPVKSNGRILFLHLEDIHWVEAADNHVRVHAGCESHLLRGTLASLESRLPSDRFLRISRSTIVNVEHISELQPLFHGEYAVVLQNGTRLTLTRGYREKLRQLGSVDLVNRQGQPNEAQASQPVVSFAIVAESNRMTLSMNRSAGLRPGASPQSPTIAPGRRPALQSLGSWFRCAILKSWQLPMNRPTWDRHPCLFAATGWKPVPLSRRLSRSRAQCAIKARGILTPALSHRMGEGRGEGVAVRRDSALPILATPCICEMLSCHFLPNPPRCSDCCMRRPWLIALVVLSFPVMALAAEQSFAPPASPRVSYNFNPGWKLFVGDPPGADATGFDDSAWKPVTLPRAWNEDAAFKVAIAELPTGIAWYRKHFKLPPAAAGRKVFLEFEGVRQAGEFYLNGKSIGRHENGVMAVGFDVTDAVLASPQENVIAVRTDNSWDYREQATGQRYQWSDRNFNANYGGIPKKVKLHVADRLYQTLPLYSRLGTVGVYVYAQDLDIPGKAATLTAESQVKNEHDSARTFAYEVTIEDMDGKVVKTFTGEPMTVAPGQSATAKASARMTGLNFWSWGYGYLYNVYTTLKVDGRAVDVVRTRTGFRKTEFSRGMLKLNDRPLQVKGYAQRTSNEWPALGMSVPPWLSDFSNGLIVEGNGNLVRWMHVTPWKQDVESCDRVGLIQAMPAGDSESDVTGRRWGQRVELMRDAIIYNRNNPSILFYESGNKGISEEHMREMKALRDQYDPHGGRAAGCREMLDSQVAEYGGEMLYINKSARLPMWATEYSRDEGLRKYWDEFSPPFHKDGDGPPYRNAPAKEYNRNQDSHAIEDVVRWYDYWRERPGTGTRVSSGGVNIIFSDSNTHFRGAENYRRSGEVDAMRIPKDAFWAHQVMWDGWVDVERPRIHIIGHWNYAPGTKKNVYVVSSAEQVELYLNEKSLGKGKQSSRFLYTFENVEWQPGALRAVGLNASGAKLCEDERQTAGEPAAVKLSLKTGPGGLKADGADVALAEVEVVDAQGRRCPTATNLVDFELSGPAEWRGGIAQGPDNYILAKSLPVECGVNRVLIRSRLEAGKILLTARSSGLKESSLELVSKPVEAANGLATLLPGDGLPSFVSRGPTPSGPAFTVSRQDVPIAGATAGTNSNRALASFDDDETTSWTNDNKLASAWIRYEFKREARPTEVTLKLNGWRQRSYPLRITVGDEEVYRGVTPRSLGYVTLPLKPATGRSLKIELISSASARDGFNITELENQQNAATAGERAGNGTLGIVEFECYEAHARN